MKTFFAFVLLVFAAAVLPMAAQQNPATMPKSWER